MDDETTATCLEDCAGGDKGLLKLRYYCFFPARKRLDMLLNYDGLNPLPADSDIKKTRIKYEEGRQKKKERDADRAKLSGFKFGVK